MKNVTNHLLLTETDTTLIRAELERLLSDRRFSGARQMSAFLRYIVSETLDGNGNRIKAYTVGVDALGKADDFDAQSDPSVRVLALRLRKSLEAAYSDDPECHAVIVMTVGSYVPEFYKPHAFASSGDDVDGFQDAGTAAVANTAHVMSDDNADKSLHDDSPNEPHLNSRRLTPFDETASWSRIENAHRHGCRPGTGKSNVARVADMTESLTAVLPDRLGVMMAIALLAAAWQVSVNSASAATVAMERAPPQAEVVSMCQFEPPVGTSMTSLLNKCVVLPNRW